MKLEERKKSRTMCHIQNPTENADPIQNLHSKKFSNEVQSESPEFLKSDFHLKSAPSTKELELDRAKNSFCRCFAHRIQHRLNPKHQHLQEVCKTDQYIFGDIRSLFVSWCAEGNEHKKSRY